MTEVLSARKQRGGVAPRPVSLTDMNGAIMDALGIIKTAILKQDRSIAERNPKLADQIKRGLEGLIEKLTGQDVGEPGMVSASAHKTCDAAAYIALAYHLANAGQMTNAIAAMGAALADPSMKEVAEGLADIAMQDENLEPVVANLLAEAGEDLVDDLFAPVEPVEPDDNAEGEEDDGGVLDPTDMEVLPQESPAIAAAVAKVMQTAAHQRFVQILAMESDADDMLDGMDEPPAEDDMAMGDDGEDALAEEALARVRDARKLRRLVTNPPLDPAAAKVRAAIQASWGQVD